MRDELPAANAETGLTNRVASPYRYPKEPTTREPPDLPRSGRAAALSPSRRRDDCSSQAHETEVRILPLSMSAVWSRARRSSPGIVGEISGATVWWWVSEGAIKPWNWCS